MTPRLSVCLASYNGARWIGDQLRSILVQLGPEDEVVVSDDGSSDGTLAVVRGLGDPRIRNAPGGPFRNPVRNFENALMQARGELIALSDQDDLWLPGRSDFIRERLTPYLGAVRLLALDARVVGATGELLHASLFQRIRAGPGLLKNVYNNTYVGACLAFTRPLLARALPIPAGTPMHDMWLGLLAERLGSVEFVPRPYLELRRHGGNATDPFTIAFRPFLQIRRRLVLSWNLARRLARERDKAEQRGTGRTA